MEAEWLPLLGITYDPKDDIIDLALEGVDHIIRKPREMYFAEEAGEFIAPEVVDAPEGVRQIVTLKDPFTQRHRSTNAFVNFHTVTGMARMAEVSSHIVHDAIETVKVRELAGVLRKREVLEDAVGDLTLAGFDRADIDIMAGIDAIKEKLVGALSVVASGGAVALAAAAAAAGGAVAGGLGGLVLSRYLEEKQAEELEALMISGGLVLWVRVRSPEQEQSAKEILRRHGGEAVRVHEITIAKRLDQFPLSQIRPDPWLGDERLGQA